MKLKNKKKSVVIDVGLIFAFISVTGGCTSKMNDTLTGLLLTHDVHLLVLCNRIETSVKT